MGYGMWQGLERATGTLANTGMRLLEYDANRRQREEQMMLDRDRLKIAQEQAAQQTQLVQMQIAKEKREQELMPLDYTFEKVGIKSPEERAVVSPYFDAHSEDIKGTRYVTRSTGAKIWEKISQDPVFNKKLGEARIDSLDKQLKDLSDPEIIKKMKPEEIQVKYESIISERTKIANGLREVDRELRAKFKESEQEYFNRETGEWSRKNPMVDNVEGLISREVWSKEQDMAMKERELAAKGTGIEDADAKKRVGFETLYPQFKGLAGTPKYADAFRDYINKTSEKITIVNERQQDIQGRSDRQYAVTLRKEFNALPEVKEYNQTVPKIKSMQAAYNESKKTNNFVAVDQALITLFNKLTDPNSVVRESEYARTAQNIPLLNTIKGKAQKVLSGGAGLTPAERKALMDMANLMQKGYEEIRNDRMKEYKKYGVDSGIGEGFLSDSGNAGKKVGRFIVEVE